MTLHRDDRGRALRAATPAQRIVSLVPSLTEAVALSCPGSLVGATDWCTHPADLDVARVRGTKNPDLDAIRALHPDLVIVNVEENRRHDVAALQADIPVWITDIRTVNGALDSLHRLLEAIGAPGPRWLQQAARAWRNPPQVRPDQPVRAVVAIWRRPWIFLGGDTYAGDVLHRLGIDNVLAADPERYPRSDLDQLPDHELVVLPDEPYAFAADDGPEAFDTRSALVKGRALTWYGPAMADAPTRLVDPLRASLGTPA